MLMEYEQTKDMNLQERVFTPTLTPEKWHSLISVEQLSADLDSIIHNFYHHK